jgi:hemoglobin-like flavoprotein
MNAEQIENVRDMFRALAPRGPELFEAFVARIRATGPGLGRYFPDQPRDHSQPFLYSAGLIIKNLHRLGAIEYLLLDMGVKNQMLGVQPQHYGMVRDAVLAVLRDAMGDAWTDEVETDWTDAIQTVTSLMILGAGRARRKAA